MRVNVLRSKRPSFVRSAARRLSQSAALSVALSAALSVALSVALSAAFVVVGAAGAAAAPPGGPVGTRYLAPLPRPAVVASFDVTATPYGPGHRGTDLRAAQGDVVTAAAEGVVSFAGSVVDRGVVVIQHRDGIRTTYEPVEPRALSGASVARGQVIAVIAGYHGGRDDVLHWGARRGSTYLDPMRLIRALGVVRLIPTR